MIIPLSFCENLVAERFVIPEEGYWCVLGKHDTRSNVNLKGIAEECSVWIDNRLIGNETNQQRRILFIFGERENVAKAAEKINELIQSGDTMADMEQTRLSSDGPAWARARPKIPRTTKPKTELQRIEDEKIDYPESFWRRITTERYVPKHPLLQEGPAEAEESER
ncbi:hypothetical protein AAVH_06401 [Aphelenchoides avenae]|nr:hypothetical protein AAVH_06401 [Aphelenchus avenae]